MVAQFYNSSITADLSGWFLLHCGGTIAWLFLFTRSYLSVAAIALMLTTIAVGLCYARVQRWRAIDNSGWPRGVASVAFSLFFGWLLLATVLGIATATRLKSSIGLKLTVWSVVYVSVLVTQCIVLDPCLSLPIAWGAMFRAYRDDAVAAPFALLFLANFVGILGASRGLS